MSLRRQHVPWKEAGKATEQEPSADDVVRSTGWVFNNKRGPELTLAEFVWSGDGETVPYFEVFELSEGIDQQTIVEIGSGIGRMTAGFTRMFRKVVACDLDAAFLERCRETVAQYGRPEALQTSHVADGRTLALPDDVADLAFSYITFQHCHHDDAMALTREALRVAKPGGHIALNYRTWVPMDALLWPAGKIVRALWRLPKIGPRLAKQRLATRLGWQANRIAPEEVLALLGDSVESVKLFRNPRRRPFKLGVNEGTYVGVHPSHWWVIARVK